MNRFISAVVVVATMTAVSFSVSGAWIGPISDKSHRGVHEAELYPTKIGITI